MRCKREGGGPNNYFKKERDNSYSFDENSQLIIWGWMAFKLFGKSAEWKMEIGHPLFVSLHLSFFLFLIILSLVFLFLFLYFRKFSFTCGLCIFDCFNNFQASQSACESHTPLMQKYLAYGILS